MICYYHPDSQAVALCRNCMRALCRECAAEVSQGLACRGRCEADAEEVIETIRQSIGFRKAAVANAKGQRSAMLVVNVFIVLFGAFFLWLGLAFDRFVWPLLILGALIGSYGCYSFIRSWKRLVPG